MGIWAFSAAAVSLFWKRAFGRRTAALLVASIAGSLLLLGFGRGTFAASSPMIEITEVVSDNESSCVEEPYEGLDWIELHNAGDTAVSLKGWTLSRIPRTSLTILRLTCA